ncbi:helix-turn-helix domain-containing protein [Moritella viscosa]|uniref:helix-turn-helix domain-containing protein n=1 Tax=Moritella viscosa TaxID=80854 RepID=UPI00094C9DAB|nr:helix-turn-helix domain-containing protein [Moritella viscosa]
MDAQGETSTTIDACLKLRDLWRCIPRHTSRIDQDVEDKVIELTLEKPHLTQIPISSEMMKRHNISISHSTIRNIWVREKRNTKMLRIERSEALAKTP